MEAIVKAQMEAIKFGGFQTHKHVAVIPMIGGDSAGPDYLTLKEAMEDQSFTVAERLKLSPKYWEGQ